MDLLLRPEEGAGGISEQQGEPGGQRPKTAKGSISQIMPLRSASKSAAADARAPRSRRASATRKASVVEGEQHHAPAVGRRQRVGEDDAERRRRGAGADSSTSSAASSCIRSRASRVGDAVERRREQQQGEPGPEPAHSEGGGAERGQQGRGEAERVRRRPGRPSATAVAGALERREQ